MKRAVICVPDPWNYIEQYSDYSLMIVNPDASLTRVQYLLEKSDYSVLVTQNGEQLRNGNDYPDEKLFWYTSGTTGDSKFCSFNQSQVDLMASNICQAYEITTNDRYVNLMGLWHGHGQAFYWATKLAKCETSFLSVKDIRALPKLSPTFITAIPDILKTVSNFEFDSLRFIRSASSALPVNLFNSLKERFRVPIIEAFGMTESLGHCFTNPLHGEQRIGTIGLPDGVDAEIFDGELHIKGPTLFKQGWYNTGDLAVTDAAGYFRIIGRKCDRINVRGFKLDPLSLEEQLLLVLPTIEQCVVFGNKEVKCLYVGDCNIKHVKEFFVNLGKHCYPKLLKQVQSIPISPSGKISRSWLNSVY